MNIKFIIANNKYRMRSPIQGLGVRVLELGFRV